MPYQNPPTVITAQPKSIGAYGQALLKYKSLIGVFAYQELKGLYAQTYFGILWSIMRPLFTLLVFTVIFKRFLHVHTDVPYYLFAFTGMIAWNFFSQIAVGASTAIIQKQSLVRKMYFPKLILPLSKIVVVGVETGISLLILFVMILFERQPISYNILTLPLFVFLNITCGFVVAIWMNALNVRFRDLNQIIPAVIGIAIWVAPVFYPTTIVPPDYSFFVFANPMAGVIKGYRFALLNEGFPEWQYWIPLLFTVLLSFAGILYFTKVESEIADNI